MENIITMDELAESFSSSYTDGTGYKEAEAMIEEFLGDSPDGSMINYSSLRIFVANLLGVYVPSQIKFEKRMMEREEYVVSVHVERYLRGEAI